MLFFFYFNFFLLYRYRESEKYRTNAEETKRELGKKVQETEEHVSNTEDDLRVEREWRISLQESLQEDREKISQLNAEILRLKAIAVVRILVDLKNLIIS